MSAKDLVIIFLKTLETRDLAAASAFLAPGIVLTFPGEKKFNTLEDLVAWSKGRYSFVRKTFDHIDEAVNGDVTTIYVRGYLNGEWLNGTPISQVRYIDRFEIKGGKIIRQDVWNDLAEFRQ